MNRCNAIKDHDGIKTWAESLLENNDNLHNKRIDISSNSTGGWHYTIDFYRTAGESDGSFNYPKITEFFMGDYYINDNTATLTDTGRIKHLLV